MTQFTLVCLTVVVMAAMLETRSRHLETADICSSSVKMSQLSLAEETILKRMTGKVLDKETEQFITARLQLRQTEGVEMFHPNSGYLLIKAFVRHWNDLIDKDVYLTRLVSSKGVGIPSRKDLNGSLAAILRLQRVYGLSSSNIYSGNYSGFIGPALSPQDAYAIGERAFFDGMLGESEDWLKLAEAESQHAKPSISSAPAVEGFDGDTGIEKSYILSLLGRVYAQRGLISQANVLLTESSKLGRDTPNVMTLSEELGEVASSEKVFTTDRDPVSPALRKLCSRGKTRTVEKLRHFHKCRYKVSLLVPYRVYKEEILSLSPYVSVFYDVISDADTEHLKKKVYHHLFRAPLYKSNNSFIRTGMMSWLSDSEDGVAARLSDRISDMTWLDVDDRNNSEQASAEKLQVLNYGLGGHFSAHTDAFNATRKSNRIRKSGNRIATFLIYLSDVQIGGNTVFVHTDISVAPVKGMALFWYNLNPNDDVDPMTKHAGCPVLKGHKWIANKWIWNFGNDYRRPCGPHPMSKQLEVEPITYSRRRNMCFKSCYRQKERQRSLGK